MPYSTGKYILMHTNKKYGTEPVVLAILNALHLVQGKYILMHSKKIQPDPVVLAISKCLTHCTGKVHSHAYEKNSTA
jgi:hypothetical protein